MGGGGGGNSGPTYTPYSVDQNALQNWINSTAQGSQYAGQLKSAQATPGYNFAQQGSSIVTLGQGGAEGMDVTGMMTAFQAWQTDQTNAASGWQSYSNLVAKEGGSNGSEGTSSILSGSAATPYQTILAAQQALGNPSVGQAAGVGNPTSGSPTVAPSIQVRTGSPVK